jgi:hypothetical protein
MVFEVVKVEKQTHSRATILRNEAKKAAPMLHIR